jgi:hypothetical protein
MPFCQSAAALFSHSGSGAAGHLASMKLLSHSLEGIVAEKNTYCGKLYDDLRFGAEQQLMWNASPLA